MKYVVDLRKSRTVGAIDRRKRKSRRETLEEDIKHLRWKAGRAGGLRVRKLTLLALDRAQEELEKLEKLKKSWQEFYFLTYRILNM